MNNKKDIQDYAEIPQEIRNFLLNLLQQAAILPVSDSMREEMVQSLYKELDRYIATKLIESIPIESIETFIDMQEKQKSKEEIVSFLLEQVPDVEQMYIDSFNEFKTMYLDGVAKARAAQN
jgi:hypothetical protein